MEKTYRTATSTVGRDTFARGARSRGANVLLLRDTCRAACTGRAGALPGLEIEYFTTMSSHGRVLDGDSRGEGGEGQNNGGKSELHFDYDFRF